MRLVHKASIYADRGTMVVTNPGTAFFTGEIPIPTEEDSRRGFLLAGLDYLFHYIRNDLWRVPVTVFHSPTEPVDIGPAERVLRLPIVVRDAATLLLGGILTDSEWRRLDIPTGDYTLYSHGYNLSAYPTDGQWEMSDEDYAQLTNVERYEFVLVAQHCAAPAVIKGNAHLY